MKKSQTSKKKQSSQTFTLHYPFEFDGQTIEQITLRRPTVLDLEAIEGEENATTKSIAMLANLSGLTPDTIRRLDAADYNRISETVLDFLELRPVN